MSATVGVPSHAWLHRWDELHRWDGMAGGRCDAFTAAPDGVEQTCTRPAVWESTVWVDLPDGSGVRIAGGRLCEHHAAIAQSGA